MFPRLIGAILDMAIIVRATMFQLFYQMVPVSLCRRKQEPNHRNTLSVQLSMFRQQNN